MTIFTQAIEMTPHRQEDSASRQFGRLECRICGRQVFAALPLAGSDGEGEANLVEITCSKGHTDRYDPALLQSSVPKPAGRARSQRAVAGIG